MKVGLVTTWNMPCGIAEYSRNLVNHLPEIEFKIISAPYDAASLIVRSRDCDLINFQYESGFLGIFTSGVMKGFNKPTVLTLHDSLADGNRQKYPFTSEADVVIVHEKTSDGFTYIPQPILGFTFINEPATYNYSVTAGFPLPWKGFELTAKATSLLVAKRVLSNGRFLGPKNPHCDTFQMRMRIHQILGSADYNVEWNDQNTLVTLIRECAVSVYPYDVTDQHLGISSAVRMGLAAKRPIVLSRSRQFRDLFDYEDEVEFVDESLSPESLAEAIIRCKENGKHPNRVVEDMSWNKAAQLYKNIYQGLV